MKKLITKKTILFASIILIAGIVAAQAFAYMGGGYHMGGGYDMMSGGGHMGYGNQMGYGMGGHGYMMENLSVEDQQKMLNQMNSFFSSTKDIREQSYQKELELNKEYAKSEKDPAKIETLQKELFDLSSQFEKQRFNHMLAIQKLFPNKDRENSRGMGGGRYGGGYGGGCF